MTCPALESSIEGLADCVPIIFMESEIFIGTLSFCLERYIGLGLGVGLGIVGQRVMSLG